MKIAMRGRRRHGSSKPHRPDTKTMLTIGGALASVGAVTSAALVRRRHRDRGTRKRASS